MTSIRFGNIVQSRALAVQETFDLVLGFIGPDLRSIKNLTEAYPRAGATWVFTDDECDERPVLRPATRLKILANLKKFEAAEVKNWGEAALNELTSKLRSIEHSKEYRILIDVSSFPRRMLAALLNSLRDAVIDGLVLRLTMCYRLALFSKPREGEAPPNRRVAPVHPSVAGWPRLPGLPVHLIVGLGYEKGKALGAVEYIQPAHLSLFSPESPEPRFAEQVRERNHELLDGTSPEAIYRYEVLDPAAQFAQLSSMLAPMLIDAKPVLLPFGPKIFFAVCILLSFNFSEVSVWHVSGEEEEPRTLVKPSDHVVYVSFSLLADSTGPV